MNYWLIRQTSKHISLTTDWVIISQVVPQQTHRTCRGQQAMSFDDLWQTDQHRQSLVTRRTVSNYCRCCQVLRPDQSAIETIYSLPCFLIQSVQPVKSFCHVFSFSQFCQFLFTVCHWNHSDYQSRSASNELITLFVLIHTASQVRNTEQRSHVFFKDQSNSQFIDYSPAD